MGIFQHSDRSIAYSIESAPFDFDLLLLQSSKFNSGFWRPVLDDLRESAPAGGRILTCEWHESGLSESVMASDLVALLQSLGMKPLSAIACGEGVSLVQTLEKNHSDVLTKKLAFAHALPKTDELIRLIREFCEI